jgi:hypothetical protein
MMNKIVQDETITRRQILRTLAAGATGLVTSVVIAKLPSLSSDGNKVEPIQQRPSEIETSEQFVMYF